MLLRFDTKKRISVFGKMFPSIRISVLSGINKTIAGTLKMSLRQHKNPHKAAGAAWCSFTIYFYFVSLQEQNMFKYY